MHIKAHFLSFLQIHRLLSTCICITRTMKKSLTINSLPGNFFLLLFSQLSWRLPLTHSKYSASQPSSPETVATASSACAVHVLCMCCMMQYSWLSLSYICLYICLYIQFTLHIKAMYAKSGSGQSGQRMDYQGGGLLERTDCTCNIVILPLGTQSTKIMYMYD